MAFCAVYLGIQIFVIVRAHFVPSKHFAFWMFPESTYFNATLTRLLSDGREVSTSNGGWAVRSDDGKVEYYWQDYVREYKLDRLGSWQRSKGVFDDTLKYFQAALDYVADRIPEDKATDRLVLRIQYERAGRPVQEVILESHARLETTTHGRP